jgi:putative acetyltransferase
MPITITEASSDSDVATVRELFRAYAESLPFSLDFQGFQAELAELPGRFSPPAGCLLIARLASMPVGIVGLKPLALGIAEIKRLYVVPEARGCGLGRALAERAIAEAGAKGYERVRLDTHRPSMAAAIALYRDLGFVEIAPYGPDLDGEIAFFEKRLSA